ncbi:hypothetical protein GCM10022631_33360 [Deinococcus rubellus]|uniref:hypothetical protein n=1 Tax=Deinococcus rubellus TaxID=1889240 RepID=UPI0031EA63D5
MDARRAVLGLLPLADPLAEAALNTPLTGAEIERLGDEMAHLFIQDQASRLDQPGARDREAVDTESTAWLKTTLSQYGWPSTNRTDSDLAFNAWLLTKHADANTAVQA